MTGLYWLVAVIASALYGWNAVAIFLPSPSASEPARARAWWWHQRWLNFLGAFVGWVALWFLLREFGTCVVAECVADIGAWDVVGALVAFVGVTGYLPSTLVSLVSGVGGLAGKLAEVLAAWVARR
jgi:hypothetical protein